MVEMVQPEGRVALADEAGDADEREEPPVGLAVAVLASVTGQTVVPMAMTEVTVRAGQLVTDAAHEVMV